MVFETYTDESDIIFKPALSIKQQTPRGRLYGHYMIDAYMLKLIKTGLVCLSRKTPSTPQDAIDLKIALELVSKEFDGLTET